MVCTLLGIYLASSHWLPCKGADSLHPAWQPVTGSIKLQVPDPHVQCHGGSYESFGDGELNGSPPCLGWPSQVTGWATPPPTLPPSMGQTLLSTQWHWVEKRGRSNGHGFCGIKSSPWLVAQRSAVASSLWLGFGHMAVDESLWVVPICSTGETITTCIHGKHLPQGLFTMIWCMCDLCQKVFAGL